MLQARFFAASAGDQRRKLSNERGAREHLIGAGRARGCDRIFSHVRNECDQLDVRCPVGPLEAAYERGRIDGAGIEIEKDARGLLLSGGGDERIRRADQDRLDAGRLGCRTNSRGEQQIGSKCKYAPRHWEITRFAGRSVGRGQCRKVSIEKGDRARPLTGIRIDTRSGDG